MKSHEEKVERPEDTSENSSACLTGAPGRHGKNEAEAAFDSGSVDQNSPRLGVHFRIETRDGRAVQTQARYLIKHSLWHWNDGKRALRK